MGNKIWKKGVKIGFLIAIMIIEIIAERINNYVVWPSRDELWNKNREFRFLPNIIGVLDGTDIEIKQQFNYLAAYRRTVSLRSR